MDTESRPVLSLHNVCRGAANELFQREVALVLDNIIDVNTDGEQKRSIIMEFTFIPQKNRRGAAVELKVKSKLAGCEPTEGNVFIVPRSGELVAVPFDPQQDELFEIKDEEVRRDKGSN